MEEINYWSVLVAAIGSFMLGALWYSPLLFMRRWSQESGINPSLELSNPAKVYGLTFMLTLLTAAVFGWLLGPAPELSSALALAGMLGIALVATSLGINYQFANRSLVLWLIDSGFHLSRLLLMGLIYWLWY